MKISELIRKGALTKAATMTPATTATVHSNKQSSVADVATVAVIENNKRLSRTEEQKLLSWLKYIGEEDLIIINEVMEICRNDLTKRQYFLNRADEMSDL